MRLNLCEILFIKESSLHRIYEMVRASSIGARTNEWPELEPQAQVERGSEAATTPDSNNNEF